MVDSSGSEDKKKWDKIKIGGVAGIGVALGAMVSWLLKNDVTPSQLIEFINNWPVVILGSAFCSAYIIVECYKQRNKTIREQNSLGDYKEQLMELKKKIKELEGEIKQKDELNVQITIEKGNLENKISYLKKEIDRLEQTINEKGGEGRANVIPFNGRMEETN